MTAETAMTREEKIAAVMRKRKVEAVIAKRAQAQAPVEQSSTPVEQIPENAEAIAAFENRSPLSKTLAHASNLAGAFNKGAAADVIDMPVNMGNLIQQAAVYTGLKDEYNPAELYTDRNPIVKGIKNAATARTVPKGQNLTADALRTGTEWASGGAVNTALTKGSKLLSAMPDILAGFGAATGEIIGDITDNEFVSDAMGLIAGLTSGKWTDAPKPKTNKTDRKAVETIYKTTVGDSTEMLDKTRLMTQNSPAGTSTLGGATGDRGIIAAENMLGREVKSIIPAARASAEELRSNIALDSFDNVSPNVDASELVNVAGADLVSKTDAINTTAKTEIDNIDNNLTAAIEDSTQRIKNSENVLAEAETAKEALVVQAAKDDTNIEGLRGVMRQELVSGALPYGATAKERAAIEGLEPAEAIEATQKLWEKRGYKVLTDKKDYNIGVDSAKKRILKVLKNQNDKDSGHDLAQYVDEIFDEADRQGRVSGNRLLAYRKVLRTVKDSNDPNRARVFSKAADELDEIIREPLNDLQKAEYDADTKLWGNKKSLEDSVTAARYSNIGLPDENNVIQAASQRYGSGFRDGRAPAQPQAEAVQQARKDKALAQEKGKVALAERNKGLTKAKAEIQQAKIDENAAKVKAKKEKLATEKTQTSALAKTMNAKNPQVKYSNDPDKFIGGALKASDNNAKRDLSEVADFARSQGKEAELKTQLITAAKKQVFDAGINSVMPKTTSASATRYAGMRETLDSTGLFSTTELDELGAGVNRVQAYNARMKAPATAAQVENTLNAFDRTLAASAATIGLNFAGSGSQLMLGGRARAAVESLIKASKNDPAVLKRVEELIADPNEFVRIADGLGSPEQFNKSLIARLKRTGDKVSRGVLGAARYRQPYSEDQE